MTLTLIPGLYQLYVFEKCIFHFFSVAYHLLKSGPRMCAVPFVPFRQRSCVYFRVLVEAHGDRVWI